MNLVHLLVLPSEPWSSRINDAIAWNGSVVKSQMNRDGRRVGGSNRPFLQRGLLIIAEERQKRYLMASDKRPLPGKEVAIAPFNSVDTGERGNAIRAPRWLIHAMSSNWSGERKLGNDHFHDTDDSRGERRRIISREYARDINRTFHVRNLPLGTSCRRKRIRKRLINDAITLDLSFWKIQSGRRTGVPEVNAYTAESRR